MNQLKEKIIKFIVWHLPKSIIYWAAIRLFAHATDEKYSKTNAVELTLPEALLRWNNDFFKDN